MARALVIEEQSGTCRGRVHPHNGYNAGNFSTSYVAGVWRGAAASRHLQIVADVLVDVRTVDTRTADAGTVPA